MPVCISGTDVEIEPVARNVARQRLLTGDRIPGSHVVLSRLLLTRGATMPFAPPAKTLRWLLLLDGTATLKTPSQSLTLTLTPDLSVFLSPDLDVTLSTDKKASLLVAETPDTGPADADEPTNRPHFMAIDWTHEEVLQTEPDARQRVRLVTGDFCGTSAIRIELVIYPPGTHGADCHHEGAAMFAYVVGGSGSAIVQGQSIPLRTGDTIYFPDRERHRLNADAGSELRFVEFYTPGSFATVWSDPSQASAWQKMGLDIEGRLPALDEAERRVYGYIFVPSLGAF